jgi:rhodanese-related sulfurtransferase
MKRVLQFAAVLVSLLLVPVAGMAAKSPMTVTGATTVTVEEAVELFDQGVVFIDVRKPTDFDAGRIPGAVHLDSTSAFNEAALEEVVAKDEPVVIYCNGDDCMRSSEASALAVSWGFTNVYYLRDGYPAWEAAGHPVE